MFSPLKNKETNVSASICTWQTDRQTEVGTLRPSDTARTQHNIFHLFTWCQKRAPRNEKQPNCQYSTTSHIFILISLPCFTYMIFPQQWRVYKVVQEITSCYETSRIITLISNAHCGLYPIHNTYSKSCDTWHLWDQGITRYCDFPDNRLMPNMYVTVP